MPIIKIHDKDIKYNSIYRRVKYPRISFKHSGVTLILPKNYRNEHQLLDAHKNWLYKKACQLEQSIKETSELQLIKDKDTELFKKEVIDKINLFAAEINVSINAVSFRKMKMKWGSCDSRGNIRINTLLRFLPDRYVDYILFHETAHMIYRKHNKEFYNFLEQKFSDSKELKRKLFSYWLLLEPYF